MGALLLRVLGMTAIGALGVIGIGCSKGVDPPADSGGGGCEAGASTAYPAGPYGASARMGTLAGDRINNFSFQGYLNLDPKTKTMKGPLQTIKLGDFYDPMAKKYRIIHIITSAGWCGPCIQETQCLVMGTAEQLAASGVVIIQALMEGVAAGTASTQADLDSWLTAHGPNFTQVLDPAAANLGLFSPASAVPFSVTVDARSMEILARDKSFTSCTKVQTELQSQITWTMNNPPLSNCP
jgi:hypothetical protein